MDKNKEPNKSVIALIMGITIGLIIGVGSTYIFMKHQEKEKIKEYEKEKLSITEKLSLEINKLGIRNTVFVYVDKIQRKIEEINSKESTEEEKVKKITKGMYAIDENGVYNEVDEDTKEVVENGIKIEGIDFGDKVPLKNSVIIINEKGKIVEAVFYIDDFKVTYDLIGTTVTKIGEEAENRLRKKRKNLKMYKKKDFDLNKFVDRYYMEKEAAYITVYVESIDDIISFYAIKDYEWINDDLADYLEEQSYYIPVEEQVIIDPTKDNSKKEETKWCTIYCSFTSKQLNDASLDLINFKNNYEILN